MEKIHNQVAEILHGEREKINASERQYDANEKPCGLVAKTIEYASSHFNGIYE